MAAQKPYLSVVIPTHNEAKRLPLTLVDIDRHLSKSKHTYEILVVDSGSTDGTFDIASKFTKMISNLKVLEVSRSVGIGGALKKGILQATGKYKLFMEADNSTTIDHFEKMQSLLRDGCKVVVGARYMKESKLKPSKNIIRSIVDGLGNLFIQILLMPGARDTQCGFKCFNADIADEVFKLQRSKGWAFNIEILVLSKRLGYKMGEIPVSWVNNPGSRESFTGYLYIFIEIFKVRWWLWRDSYGIKRK